MKNVKYVGVTLSIQLYDFIQQEIKDGLYSAPADWIRSACREYYEKRIKDRLGGGAFLKFNGLQKNIQLISAVRSHFLIDTL